eukprot:6200841-Amphidinium_carterae.2
MPPVELGLTLPGSRSPPVFPADKKKRTPPQSVPHLARAAQMSPHSELRDPSGGRNLQKWL